MGAAPRPPRPLRRLATGLGLVLVIGLAVALRLLDSPAIFTEDGIRAAGPDAYYHLRRIAFSYERFPEMLTRDPYLNHPHGGEAIWPPGLDWSVAALARAWLGVGASAERLERFALAVPPVLGALAVAGVFVFAARRFSAPAGLVAAALLALLPGHVVYTRLGMLDHHALEPIFTLGFLAAGTGLVATADRGGGRLAAAALALAAVSAGAFLVWPGFLLQLALVDAVLVGMALLGAPGAGVRRLALAAAGAHGLGALLLAPWAGNEWEYWGGFAPVVLSAFQPWLLGSAACVLAVLAWFARAGPPWRLAAAAGAGLVLLALSSALFPELAEAPARIWGWLARAEGFQAQVAESRPLLSADPKGRLAAAARLLSWLVVATPVVLVLHARSARGAEARARWVLVSLALGLGLATLAQRRFVSAFAVPHALLWGWLLGAALPAWLARRAPARGARAGVPAVAGVLVVLALLPIRGALEPALERRAQRAAGNPLRLSVDQWRRHELHGTADWLRRNTPETSGYLDPSLSPEYGVLAHWSNGHILTYVARRPTVVTNFGNDLGEEGFAAAARYFQAPEPEASALLDRLRVRYAIIEYRRQPPLHSFDEHSMIARGSFADGGHADRSPRWRGGRELEVAGEYPAFTRHRLVYEARRKPWAPEHPFFKVYEHVAGAWVEGRAPAGAPVRFTLRLVTQRGRRITWRALTRADADGRYGLRLPHATRGGPEGVRPLAPYGVDSDGIEAELAVDERDVQEGRTVAGPDLTKEGA